MLENIEGRAEKRRNELIVAIIVALLLAIFFIALTFSKAASAQMSNEAWGFKQQNRASIAALMQQVENSNDSGAVTSSGSAGFDQLVCGGDGQSSATGNSTCIIMNNSNGAIELGQDVQGNQDATNSENTTLSGLSDVLETIQE